MTSQALNRPVDVKRLKEIAASSGETAKTNALINAANEIDRLRDAMAAVISAASALTVSRDGRSYFESGQATDRFRSALAAIGSQP